MDGKLKEMLKFSLFSIYKKETERGCLVNWGWFPLSTLLGKRSQSAKTAGCRMPSLPSHAVLL